MRFHIHPIFLKFFDYIYNLGFYDTPDYDYIAQNLRNLRDDESMHIYQVYRESVPIYPPRYKTVYGSLSN